MQRSRLTILENLPLGPDYGRITVKGADGFLPFSPGVFITVGLAHLGGPLLNRPMSISGVFPLEDGDTALQFIYKAVGPGTRLMAGLKPGDEIEILGPLGEAFPVIESAAKAVMVAGGVGLPPLMALARLFTEQHPDTKLTFIYGGRGAADIICMDELINLGAELIITTEDGAIGREGLVTQAMTDASMADADVVYTCGPLPMMKAVATIAEDKSIACYASLENHMCCGFGACLGCVQGVKDDSVAGMHFERCCVEGPVFDSRSLVW